MKNKKGFTLLELVIVIVIVGVLSIVAVPVYRSYTENAYLTEAKALLGGVYKAEKIYYVEFGRFAVGSAKDSLGIDSSGNKFFRNFEIVETPNGGFSAYTNGEGPAASISLALIVGENSAPYWSRGDSSSGGGGGSGGA